MGKKAKACYTNRELSWLSFNERVLNEAANPRVPLAERLTFASIYQTNLDEFFMVRVGTLMTQMNSKKKVRENKTKMTAKEQVEAILEKTRELEIKKAVTYEQLMGELEPNGIRLINFNRLSSKEGAMLEQYFDLHIAPFLNPMVLGRQQPFPFLESKQLYAVVLLSNKQGKKKIGLVPCSNSVFKRMVEIPTRPGTFMLTEELILHFISKLYSKYIIREKAVMRVTRNADIDALEMIDEDLDYRDMMKHLLKKRSRMSPVRVELSRNINKKVKEELANYLDVNVNQFIEVKTPLDMSFVFELQNRLSANPQLFYNKRYPRNSVNVDIRRNILDQLEAKGDILLSYPYESMRPFVRMLEEAADDDSVVSIKMSLYRVAERSKIIDALVDAAENGKEVVVVVELRARFDESNNIETSSRLEDAGCTILYGLEDYKVHSKLCLITRADELGNYTYYSQIGTGNYNEKTSRLYTDYSLMTADQEIGAEVAEVFACLQRGETVEDTKHLLVAPNCLQNRILDMIDEQIEVQNEGGNGYIGIKINSLTDKKIISKLVEASQAGVKIELIVRGICCLKPGVPEYTENITVISIVGRYLEHSRVYRFGKGEDEKVYIGSADFMTRNTTRRVEVATPIYSPALRKKICDNFDLQMMDDEKGKEQGPDGIYYDRSINESPINSQEVFFQQAYDAYISVAANNPAAIVLKEESIKTKDPDVDEAASEVSNTVND